MKWILPIALLFSISCNKPNAPDCFQKAGDDRTEERFLNGEILSVEIFDLINLVLVPSADQKVVVTAPENLLPEIITELSDGNLLIDNENTCNFVRKYGREIRVEVHGDIEHVVNWSTGNISSADSLQVNSFILENHDAAGIIDLTFAHADLVKIEDHTGVAEVYLHGETQHAELFNQGLGVLDASDMKCAGALTNNSSINILRLRVTDYLFAAINKSGNTEYYGNPATVDTSIEGSGELISLD